MVDLVETDSDSEGDSDDGDTKPFVLPASPPAVESPALVPEPAPAPAPTVAVDPEESARRIKVN